MKSNQFFLLKNILFPSLLLITYFLKILFYFFKAPVSLLPSSLDIIDPAIMRPGRLDKTLFVGLPPPADRLAILKTITKVSEGDGMFLCLFLSF